MILLQINNTEIGNIRQLHTPVQGFGKMLDSLPSTSADAFDATCYPDICASGTNALASLSALLSADAKVVETSEANGHRRLRKRMQDHRPLRKGMQGHLYALVSTGCGSSAA